MQCADVYSYIYCKSKDGKYKHQTLILDISNFH